MNYSEICREAFALVDDIGKGNFNTEFSERGTLATTGEVVMPVLAIFRELISEDPTSVSDARSRLEEIATSEQGVFSRYPAFFKSSMTKQNSTKRN